MTLPAMEAISAQYLTPNRSEMQVLRSFDFALDLSNRAIDAESRGDQATAIALWRQVYGRRISCLWLAVAWLQIAVG